MRQTVGGEEGKSTDVDKMAKNERSGGSKKAGLKLLSHRKSSLTLAFFLTLTQTHTHTHTGDDTTQESDGCRKGDVCLELSLQF